MTADIWFVVNVPVLSLQMTLVQPSVSTLGNLRTMAFFFAIFLVPSAKHVVITAGRPSGIAATASAKLLPLAIIGSGLLFGAKTIEFGVSRDRDAERKLKAGAAAADDPWSPTDVNARAAAEEEEDFEETVKANWDARFRALDGKRKQK